MKLSVIVPVFNVADYLRKNYEHLGSQLSDDFELIYVNDGSTDEGPEILHKMTESASNVKIISQDNSGLSVARNVAIRASKGDYIVLVDGDDYLVDGALQRIYDVMNNNQLQVLHYHMEDDNKYESNTIHMKAENVQILLGKECLKKGLAEYTGCLYAYRRDFIMKYGLFYVPNIYHEDNEYIVRALFYAERVGIISDILYERVIREGSITQSRNVKRYRDLLTVGDIIAKFCDENVLDDSEMKCFYESYINFVYAQGINGCIRDDFEISEIMNNDSYERIQKVLCTDTRQKYRLLGWCMKNKFMNVYAKVYRKYYGLKK